MIILAELVVGANAIDFGSVLNKASEAGLVKTGLPKETYRNNAKVNFKACKDFYRKENVQYGGSYDVLYYKTIK